MARSLSIVFCFFFITGLNYGHNLSNYSNQEHHFMAQEMKPNNKNCTKERDDGESFFWLSWTQRRL